MNFLKFVFVPVKQEVNGTVILPPLVFPGPYFMFVPATGPLVGMDFFKLIFLEPYTFLRYLWLALI
jgi:hypothetical protein